MNATRLALTCLALLACGAQDKPGAVADDAATDSADDAGSDSSPDADSAPESPSRARAGDVPRVPGPWYGVSRAAEINGRGGTFRFDDLVIVVPTQAVDATAVLRVSALAETPPPGVESYSPIYEISVSSRSPVRQPLQVELPYFGPTGRGASDHLRAYKVNDGNPRVPYEAIAGAARAGRYLVPLLPGAKVFVGPLCAVPGSCPCETDEQCLPYAGPDKCKPQRVCSPVTHECVPSPAVAKVCPAPTNSACEKTLCVPDTGQCLTLTVPAPCDDGSVCTGPDVCVDGLCAGEADLCECTQDVDCAGKNGGDLCAGSFVCDLSAAPYTCVLAPESVVTCAENPDPCKSTSCDPATGGCTDVAEPDGKVCPGDLCHTAACAAGVCVKSAQPKPGCQCAADADCAAIDDGNLCNGTLYCNLQTQTCAVNPATKVYCPTVNDTACEQNVCVPATGACAMKPVPDGTPYDDGNQCTKGEVCVGGSGGPGEKACECTSSADCASKDDKCKGYHYCDFNTFKCVLNPISPVVCPSWPADGNPCVTMACDPATGACVPKPKNEGKGCDDQNACTDAACQAGACVAVKDHCQCQSDASCGKFENQDLCDGTLYCHKGQVPFVCKPNPATVKTCPNGLDGPCEQTVCVPETGACEKVEILEGKSCDNAVPCLPKHCVSGECVQQSQPCACTQDSMCPGNPGNLCVGAPYCSKATAQWTCAENPATQKKCFPDNACDAPQCIPGTGTCQHVPAPAGTTCVMPSTVLGICDPVGMCFVPPPPPEE